MVKPKLLYVADTFLPKKDGVITFMMETAKRLKDDFDISFLVPRFEGSEGIAKNFEFRVTFVPVRRFAINDYKFAHPKSNILKKEIDTADIIFVHSGAFLGYSTIKTAKKMNKQTVLYVHSIDWELLASATRFPGRATRLLKPLVRLTHKRSGLIIVPARKIAQKISTKKIKNRIKIVNEGVDRNRFCSDNKIKVIMRKKLGLRGKFVIGYVGRLSKEKNLNLLAHAFQIVKKTIPNAALLLVGAGPAKKKLPKRKDIIFTGFVENPEDYLRAMNVFVLLSKTETTALSLMEAMSCGLPVVASSVGAIPSYVKNKRNGLLISKKNLKPANVAKQILTLYANPALRNHLRKNAEKTVREFYTWDKTALELKRIFNGLLE